MFKIIYTPEARRRIRKLDASVKRRLKVGIETIAKSPDIGKKLTHHLRGKYSHRVGKYRILYRVNWKERIVLILTLGHRKKIYRKK